MRRHLLNVLAITSLLLCAAMVALWVRSYWVGYALSDARVRHPSGAVEERRRSIIVFRGEVLFTSAATRYTDAELTNVGIDPRSITSQFRYWTLEPTLFPGTRGAVNSGGWQFAGIRWGPLQSGGLLLVPMWLIVSFTSIVPIYRLIPSRRKTREPLCPACGYDLRATPDRCPECGTVRTQSDR